MMLGLGGYRISSQVTSGIITLISPPKLLFTQPLLKLTTSKYTQALVEEKF